VKNEGAPAAAGQGDEMNAKPLCKAKSYRVYVDDNFHYQDESERYLEGEYGDCPAAVAACRRIVDDYLDRALPEAGTEKELWRSYTLFGEDPFIVVTDGKKNCSFSAWDYARERIRDLVGSSGVSSE